ncbi:Uncharacterised protein [uncultured archaeon]|nr:Uncharacterised protein [uncultured archaeon]
MMLQKTNPNEKRDGALGKLDRMTWRTQQDGRMAFRSLPLQAQHALLAEAWAQKMERAEADLTKAIELEPNDLFAYLKRMSVRKRLGDKQGAASDFKAILEIQKRKLLKEAEKTPDARYQDFLREQAQKISGEAGI